jgi:hypothetical protein
MARLKASPGEIEKFLLLLASTPVRIAASAQGYDEAALSYQPGPRAWSALDVLAHMRACADLWTYSIYAMLAEVNPALALLDERRWAKAAGYSQLRFQPSLQAYSLQREELMAVLRSLPAEKWERTANIGGRSHSVFSQSRRMALHEEEHCQQIERILHR